MLHHHSSTACWHQADHCRDGKLIRPIIEITGYPAALKEIAPPTPCARNLGSMLPALRLRIATNVTARGAGICGAHRPLPPLTALLRRSRL